MGVSHSFLSGLDSREEASQSGFLSLIFPQPAWFRRWDSVSSYFTHSRGFGNTLLSRTKSHDRRTRLIWVHPADQVLRATQLHRGHGSRNGSCPRAHPVHHPTSVFVVSAIVGLIRLREGPPPCGVQQGSQRGDCYVYPRRCRGCRSALSQTVDPAEGNPSWQGR